MDSFDCFATLPIFSYQSGSYWFGMAKFGCLQLFQYFPTKVVWINLEWLILVVLHFSNIFWLRWSKLIQNGCFATFSIFYYWSILNWFGMTNFGHFATFSIFCYWSVLNWLGMANFDCFTTLPVFSYQRGTNWFGIAKLAFWHLF